MMIKGFVDVFGVCVIVVDKVKLLLSHALGHENVQKAGRDRVAHYVMLFAPPSTMFRAPFARFHCFVLLQCSCDGIF